MLSRTAAAILLVELLSGLAVTLGPFHPAVEWGVLLHTALIYPNERRATLG
jgi:hypothetical protein